MTYEIHISWPMILVTYSFCNCKNYNRFETLCPRFQLSRHDKTPEFKALLLLILFARNFIFIFPIYFYVAILVIINKKV
jgi:hypothetical protein